nr:reverse transcriptase domain-containing protein [Tanacetum cinerariifolium]
GFTTFSNVLFDADYDSDSSDDQSFSDEDFLKKIYSNPLFDEEITPIEIDQHSLNAESDLIESMPNHDFSVIISSKIDSLFNEFAGELTLLKSIPSGIDETDCHPEKEIRFAKRLLYDNSSPRPPKQIVFDNSNADIESFSPSPIPNEDSDSHMEEIDLSFNPDDLMPPRIEEDDNDSERDIPILEELLDNYSLSLPDNESYHFDIPSPYRPPAKPPDGKTGTLNIKIMGGVSDQKVPIPGLTITRVSNRDKSLDLLFNLGLEAFQPSAKCPMIINGKNTPVLDFPLSIFTPLINLTYWALKQANFDLAAAGDHRKIQLNELNELHEQAYENSLIYKEKTKRIHDSKIKNRVSSVGDRVLLFNSRLKIFSGKLKTRWSGPFTITKVFRYGTVELSQANGPNFKVNGHRIKHYFGGDVPQSVVPNLQTFSS